MTANISQYRFAQSVKRSSVTGGLRVPMYPAAGSKLSTATPAADETTSARHSYAIGSRTRPPQCPPPRAISVWHSRSYLVGSAIVCGGFDRASWTRAEMVVRATSSCCSPSVHDLPIIEARHLHLAVLESSISMDCSEWGRPTPPRVVSFVLHLRPCERLSAMCPCQAYCDAALSTQASTRHRSASQSTGRHCVQRSSRRRTPCHRGGSFGASDTQTIRDKTDAG